MNRRLLEILLVPEPTAAVGDGGASGHRWCGGSCLARKQGKWQLSICYRWRHGTYLLVCEHWLVRDLVTLAWHSRSATNVALWGSCCWHGMDPWWWRGRWYSECQFLLKWQLMTTLTWQIDWVGGVARHMTVSDSVSQFKSVGFDQCGHTR